MNQRRVFIRNWIVDGCVGIYPEDKNKTHPLRLNISLFQDDTPAAGIADVMNYADHKKRFEEIVLSGHHPLIEQLAHKLADASFQDAKVRRITVEIEKLEILPGVESCGVVVEKSR